MTWKEFKARVEELGVRDEDRITAIDVVSHWPFVIERDEHGCVDVFYAPDGEDAQRTSSDWCEAAVGADPMTVASPYASTIGLAVDTSGYDVG